MPPDDNGDGIAKRVVKPNECVLAFGIPTSEDGFRRARDRPNTDFARRFANWGKYHAQFVSVLERIEPGLEHLGVRVVHDLALDDLAKAMSNSRVFVLFSHWGERAIEFSDGMQSLELVASRIPADFYGVLDLCVCQSYELAAVVRSTRCCLVRHVAGDSQASSERARLGEVTPERWLFVYLAAFKYLEQHEATYSCAVESVILQLLGMARRKR